MRNLKRVLSLALALVMVLGLMVITGSAASKDFDDSAEINENYVEAIDVLTAIGIIEGDDTGNLNPTDVLSREEAAKIITYLVLGADAAEQVQGFVPDFDDVEEGRWSAGYIAYCANVGMIDGYGDGTFGPTDDLTGIAFAKFLLVALGYDTAAEGYANVGPTEWAKNVAIDAVDAGLTLDGILLSAPLTREQAIQMAFQALQADAVDYVSKGMEVIASDGTVVRVGVIGPYAKLAADTTKDYDTTGTDTDKTVQLAEKLYPTLTKDGGKDDDWGRPAVKGWTYGEKADRIYNLIAEPVAEYTVAVDECDIAKAVGLKKSTKIEAAYIDGETYTTTDKAVTTNRFGNIDPTATTSIVGAQGRITEVYDMGDDGIRLVEINTYLAQVTNVTPATTDKNGHVVAGYSTLTVHTNASANTGSNTDVGVIRPGATKTVFTTNTSFDKGSYVLVTANAASMKKTTSDATKKGLVATIEQTAPVTVGTTKAFNAATTTIGDTTYTNADKFALNYTDVRNTTSGKSWDVFTDSYGNIIGAVETTTNYLVIEAVRWIDAHTEIFGGYALADIVLANGERIQGVTIAKVGTNAANNGDDVADLSHGVISDSETANGAYYKHIFAYTVNANGTYNISATAACTGQEATSVTIKDGITTIGGNTNTVVANNDTVFLLKNQKPAGDGYSYSVYVGKNNVPDVESASIHWLTNANGYATLVVVDSYVSASNRYVAYVTGNTYTDTGVANGTAIYAYNVYKTGETEPTKVWSTSSTGLTSIPGFFQITVGNNGIVSGTAGIIGPGAYEADSTVASNTEWNRAYFKALEAGSLQTTKQNYTDAYADYEVDDAQYIVVTDYGTRVTVTAGSTSDLASKDQVIVVDKGQNGVDYVYIFKTGTPSGVNNPDGDWVHEADGYGYSIAAQEVYAPDGATLAELATKYSGSVTATYTRTTADGVTEVVTVTDTANGGLVIDSLLSIGAEVTLTNTNGTWDVIS